METYFKNNNLIEEKKWFEFVESLRTEKPKEVSLDELKDAFIDAVKKRIPKERFGIFFSGGIDSSLVALVCKNLGYNFTCYTVGFKTRAMEMPEDILWAQKVAHSLNLNLVVKTFDEKQAGEIIKKVVKIVEPNVVNVGVGSVIYAVAKIAKEKVFFSGLGSEEIFAGYERHAKAEDVQEECWKGLKAMWKRDLLRDVNLARYLGIEIRTPFLDKELIKFAMQIPIEKKIDKINQKIIIRKLAEDLGLAEEFSWRKKKAAQYGSKFDRAIKKLAEKHKFKYKSEYLKFLWQQKN